MTPRMHQMRIGPLFARSAFASVLLFGVLWINYLPSPPSPLGLLLGAVGVALNILICWLTVLAVAATFKIGVAPNGITAHDFWGRSRFLRWEEIDGCRPITVVNLGYARLSASERRVTLWVPMYLKDARGFVEDVRELAPADSFLRRELPRQLDGELQRFW